MKHLARGVVIGFLVIVSILTGCSRTPEEPTNAITITTDEDAIAFANQLRSDLSQHKPELAQPFDGALVMTLSLAEINALGLSKQEWFSGNETFYLVSWETASGSFVKLCSTAFTTIGVVALEPSCAVTEIVEEDTETEEAEENNAVD